MIRSAHLHSGYLGSGLNSHATMPQVLKTAPTEFLANPAEKRLWSSKAMKALAAIQIIPAPRLKNEHAFCLCHCHPARQVILRQR